MKRLSLILGAVVIGFLFSACTKSPKEPIMKETEAFFAEAENTVKAITNAEDFLKFFKDFSWQKDDFMQNLFSKYPTDAEGKLKGITDEELEELNTFIQDCETAYKTVEVAKCAEVVDPVLARYERAVQALYACHQAGTDLEDALVDEFEAAYAALEPCLMLDDLPASMHERFQAADTMLEEMFSE